MPLKRLGIERPDFENLDERQQQYLSVLETMAFAPSQQQELKNSLDPRTWPVGVYVVLAGWVLTAFLWAFNSGGKWTTIETRITSVESRVSQDENIYARRDLLEQQMNYIVTNLNELKIKVDQLTASKR